MARTIDIHFKQPPNGGQEDGKENSQGTTMEQTRHITNRENTKESVSTKTNQDRNQSGKPKQSKKQKDGLKAPEDQKSEKTLSGDSVSESLTPLQGGAAATPLPSLSAADAALLEEPARKKLGRPPKPEPDWTIPPERWAGTSEEWADEMAALDPHHCSYPTGRPLARQSGRPCHGRRAGPNGRCAWHGGRNAIGPAHGHYKHGRYSKYVPAALAKQYRAAEGNPELLSLRSDVAVIESMIAERLENMNAGGGTADDWRDAHRQFRSVVAAIQGGDPQELDNALRELGGLLETGAKVHKQRAEVSRMIDTKGRATDRENRRLKDLQQYMTMQQALALMGFLAESINRHCHDQHARQLIHGDFARILDGKGVATGGRGIQTIDAPPATASGGHGSK